MYNKRTLYALVLSFFILIVLILALGISQIIQYDTVSSITNKMYKHPFTVINTSRSINTTIVKMHRGMKDVTLSTTHQEAFVTYAHVNKLEQKVFNDFKVLYKGYLGDSSEIKRVEERFRQWKPIRQEIYKLVVQKKAKEAAQITKNEGAKYVQSLTEDIKYFILFAENKAQEILKNSHAKAQVKKKKHTLILILIIIFSLVLVYFITSYIHRLFRTIHENNAILEHTNRALNEAQKLAKIGSWRIDHRTGKLSWSHQVFMIFELDQTDTPLSYEEFLNCIHPEDMKKVDAAYQKSIKEQTGYEIEHRILFKNGRVKYVREKADNIFDDDHQLIISTGTIQDITQEVSIENTHKAEARLSQMGEMLAMIAHQWRQPLTSIAVVTSDVKVRQSLGTLTEEMLNQKLDNVISYTSELSKTISDFQNYFKPDKKSKTFSLSNLVHKSLSLSEGLFTHACVLINKEIKEDLPAIHNLENEILQVILSIYNNAVDAINESVPLNGELNVTLSKADNRLHLSISDNAGGIPANIIDHIFDPYFSTKSKNGTGLALFISKTIIEEHCHGTLTVKNEAGGACFTLSFPIELPS